MIKSILSAIISVIIPRLTYYRMNKMEKEYNKLISTLIKTMITFIFPVIVGINIVAHELIIVISGYEYIASQIPLQILSLAIFGSIFGGICVSGVLLANRLEKIALKATVAAAVVNLLTNIIAIPLWGENGAAVTTVISEFVVLGISWYYAKNLVKLENMINVVISSVIGCFVMIGISLIINTMISHVLICLILKVVCCAITYGICLLILKNEIALEYLNLLVSKLCNK
jgi:O-antigen/teichoic acid export membrane protein